MIDNLTFLRAVFGEQYPWSHVTSFIDDPGNIPNERRGVCWSGGYYQNTTLTPDSNQFYTVSVFAPDENNRSKRRKVQFSAQHVVVLDDVKEKLPLSEVNKLPPPSFKLLTSNHSEQWGYILLTPETNRNRLDNLTDQLISNGLAPDANDPGMKGVTRYVRLPEGVNTKLKRITENNGVAPRTPIIEWSPDRKYTLEQLAEPFNVQLDAPRRESRVDGASDIPDHPVLSKLNVKTVLSAGRYDITCPWVGTHTGAEDNGTAIFTNDDGSVGIQCHHGHCQDKNAGDLLDWIESTDDGFKTAYKHWQISRTFADVSTPPSTDNIAVLDFMGQDVITHKSYQDVFDDLRVLPLHSAELLEKLEQFLHLIDDTKELERNRFHKEVCTMMEWNKVTFNKIMAQYREEWYQNTGGDYDWLLSNIILITEGQGGFYNLDRKVFQTGGAMNATYGHMNFSGDNPSSVIINSKSKKIADGMGWHPVEQDMFQLNGRYYVNSYCKPHIVPKKCNVDMWLELVNFIFGDHAKLLLDHMAFSVQHPEVKIRWQFLTWGMERTGKSMSVRPLIKIMGDSASEISNDQFENGYDDIYAGMKVLSFEEVMQNDTRQFNRLKSKLANDGLEKLNIKSRGMITQQNLYSMYLFSNHEDALQFSSTDGKLLVVQSPSKFIKEEGSKEWYTTLGKLIDSDADFLAGCYWLLLNRDVNNFQYSVLPEKTDAMIKMVKASRPEYEQVVMDLIQHKEEMFEHDIFKLESLMSYLRNRGYRFARKNLIKRLKIEGYDSYKAAKTIEGKLKQLRFWGANKTCALQTPLQLYDRVTGLPPLVKMDLMS